MLLKHVINKESVWPDICIIQRADDLLIHFITFRPQALLG